MTLGNLVVSLRLDTDEFTRPFAEAARTTNERSRQIAGSMQLGRAQTQQTFQQMGSGLSTVNQQLTINIGHQRTWSQAVGAMRGSVSRLNSDVAQSAQVLDRKRFALRGLAVSSGAAALALKLIPGEAARAASSFLSMTSAASGVGAMIGTNTHRMGSFAGRMLVAWTATRTLTSALGQNGSAYKFIEQQLGVTGEKLDRFKSIGMSAAGLLKNGIGSAVQRDIARAIPVIGPFAERMVKFRQLYTAITPVLGQQGLAQQLLAKQTLITGKAKDYLSKQIERLHMVVKGGVVVYALASAMGSATRTAMNATRAIFNAGVAATSFTARLLGLKTVASSVAASALPTFFRKSETAAAGFEGKLTSVVAKLDNTSKRITALTSAGALAVGGGIAAGAGYLVAHGADVGKSLFKMSTQAETTRVKFGTLLGSQEKAVPFLRELREIGSRSPFEPEELQDYAKQLLSVGVNSEKVAPSLNVLGNIAAGSDSSLSSLVDVYARAKDQDKIYSTDLRQLTRQNVPIVQALAKEFGVNEDAIHTMADKGVIHFGHLQKAMIGLQEKGGQFAGAMDKQSKTLAGQWKYYSEQAALLGSDVSAAFTKHLNFSGAKQSGTDLVEWFRGEWMPRIEQVMEGVAGFVNTAVGYALDAWNTWGKDAVEAVASFVGNWETYMQIAGETAYLFYANTIERMKTWGTNAVEILSWFKDNWSDIFFTSADYAMTVMINLGKNLRTLFSNLWKAIRGEMKFSDVMKGMSGNLTEGAVNTIKKMPQLTKAQITEMTPALESLYAKLGQREAEARAKQLAKTPTKNVEKKVGGGLDPDKINHTDKSSGGNAAKLRGSAESLAVITGAAGKDAKILKVNEEQLKIQKQQLEVMKNGKHGAAPMKAGNA